MQFCWLQPDLRPCSEEVHLLVTYLCAKGSSEVEEEFEQRWNALKPNLLGSTSHASISTALVLTPMLTSASNPGAEQPQAAEPASSASSSFPLLEQFSDSFHSDTGDDLLTVTETSRGLNFEYKWEQARAEQPYCSSSTFGPLGQGNPHYQDIYYSSIVSVSGACKSESMTADLSPRYYEPEQPGVVPVLSAHSPSVGSEYYIRIEGQAEHNINSLDGSIADYSPGVEAQSCGLSSETRLSATQRHSYWTTEDNTQASASDSDPSPTVHVTIEPFLKQASTPSPVKLDETRGCVSSSQDDVTAEQTSVQETQRQTCLSELETSPESRSKHVQPGAFLDIARHQSQPVSSPSLGFCDPYLEVSAVSESCFHRKTPPIVSHISIDVERDSGLLLGQQRHEDIDHDFFFESESSNWTSNHSANNNSLAFDSRLTTESWSSTKATTRSSKSNGAKGDPDCIDTNTPSELGTFIPEGKQSSTDLLTSSSPPLSGKECGEMEGKFEKDRERYSELKALPKVNSTTSPSRVSLDKQQPCQPGQAAALTAKQRGNIWEGVSMGIGVGLGNNRPSCPEVSQDSSALGGGGGASNSGFNLVELGDYSEEEEDITDITSGIFADFNLDYAEVEEEELSPVRNPERTLDSVETLTLCSSIPSTSDPSDQAFSPDPYNNPVLPKSLDSGYDTENNESPEFIFKELADARGGERSPRMGGELGLVLQVGLGQALCTSTSTSDPQIKSLADETLYRDSDYFSDYDAEYERSPQEDGSIFCEGSNNGNFIAEKSSSARNHKSVQKLLNHGAHLPTLSQLKRCVLVDISDPDTSPSSPHPTPGLSMLSPFPPQMGGCLTKESGPADENLGLDTEHSVEEPSSELSSSIGSEPSSTVQEAPGAHEEGNGRQEDCSRVQALHLDSTVNTFGDEASKENEKGDGTRGDEELPDFNYVSEEGDDGREAVRINEEDFEDIDAEECNSQDSLCEEPNGPLDLSSSSSFLELCGEQVRAPLEEAEEEYDSEDSESDEELRTYNIQDEDSEESEDDLSVVPVVVSDCSRARHLRSLLKMPTLLTQSFCDELERKKKAVSFFDDVTVFLFDQVGRVEAVL